MSQLAVIWGAALLVSLLAWIFASPVGASPDEPSHMAFAWGLATGQDVLSGDLGCDTNSPTCAIVVEVPKGLIPDPECYRRTPAIPGDCEGDRSIAAQGTRTIRYPPPYYLLVGGAMRGVTELGLSANDAGLVGRLASSLIVLSLLVPALVVASRRVTKVLPFVVVSLTPITLFVSSSVNPSGPEIAGAIAVSTALVALASSLAYDRWTATTFIYGVAWLAWARPLGFLWAGALLVFGLLYVHVGHDRDLKALRKTTRRLLPLLSASVALVLSAMAWFGYSLQVRSTGAGPPRTVPDPGIERLLAIPFRWGDMLWETVGVLGWLRLPLPTPLMLMILGALVAMVTLSTTVGSGDCVLARGIVVRYLMIMTLGITAIMYRTNFLWQGRYAIPALVGGLILWGGTSSQTVEGPLRRLSVIGWFGSSMSLLWVIARYSYGLEIERRYMVPNFSDGAHWVSPVGGIGVVLLGLLSGISIPLALRMIRYSPLPDGDTARQQVVSGGQRSSA